MYEGSREGVGWKARLNLDMGSGFCGERAWIYGQRSCIICFKGCVFSLRTRKKKRITISSYTVPACLYGKSGIFRLMESGLDIRTTVVYRMFYMLCLLITIHSYIVANLHVLQKRKSQEILHHFHLHALPISHIPYSPSKPQVILPNNPVARGILTPNNNNKNSALNKKK